MPAGEISDHVQRFRPAGATLNQNSEFFTTCRHKLLGKVKLKKWKHSSRHIFISLLIFSIFMFVNLSRIAILLMVLIFRICLTLCQHHCLNNLFQIVDFVNCFFLFLWNKVLNVLLHVWEVVLDRIFKVKVNLGLDYLPQFVTVSLVLVLPRAPTGCIPLVIKTFDDVEDNSEGRRQHGSRAEVLDLIERLGVFPLNITGQDSFKERRTSK